MQYTVGGLSFSRFLLFFVSICKAGEYISTTGSTKGINVNESIG